MVFYGAELPPLVHKLADGRLGGFAVDILREVARNSGGAIPEPQIEHVPWARALSECRYTPGCALLCMVMLPSRKAEYKWVGPIARIPLGVYARKSSGITIGKPEDLAGYRIGAVRNTAPIKLLGETPGLEGVRLEQVNSIRSSIRMMQAGRLELTVQSEPGFVRLLREMGIPRADFVKVFDMEPVGLYFAFHRDCDDAYIARLQAGLDALKVCTAGGMSRYEELRRKYWPQGSAGACALQSR